MRQIQQWLGSLIGFVYFKMLRVRSFSSLCNCFILVCTIVHIYYLRLSQLMQEHKDKFISISSLYKRPCTLTETNLQRIKLHLEYFQCIVLTLASLGAESKVYFIVLFLLILFYVNSSMKAMKTMRTVIALIVFHLGKLRS